MPTLRTRPPRVKPVLSCHLSTPPDGPIPGVLWLGYGTKEDGYFLRRLASDFGTAFDVTKWGGDESYHVNIGATPADHICSCLGWLQHGHCKHVSGLAQLVEGGVL